jgi:alpha-tubulin suppressor-like RCC1 family protein
VADPPPAIGTAIPGDGRALVSWSPPVVSATPTVAYVVTTWLGNTKQASARFDSTATTEIVGGLTNGFAYTFTVEAMNGNGDASASSGQSNPVIPGQQLAATRTSTCAIVAGGEVKCWGDGNATPAAVPDLTGATAISGGWASVCALISDGSVKCWGDNSSGELGDGTTTASSSPVTVVGITDATAIAARDFGACARLGGGTVKCWGYNEFGELGNGTDGQPSSSPVTVVGITDAATIGAGRDHTCAVLTGGGVKCWGDNSHGVLGDGNMGTFDSIPVTVVGISTATLVTGGSGHTCVRLPGGVMKCWGERSAGRLGDGTGGDGTGNPALTPVSVVGMTGARVITAGFNHTCAIIAGGMAQCWGNDLDGEIGDGNYTYPAPNIPTLVVGIANATALQTGDFHTCAVVPGAVRCWGSNDYGQLGNGSVGGSTPTPTDVVGL